MYLAVADGDQVLNMTQWVSLQGQTNGAVAIILPTYSYVFFAQDTSSQNPINRNALVALLHASKDADLGIVSEVDFEAFYAEAVAKENRMAELRKALGGN